MNKTSRPARPIRRPLGSEISSEGHRQIPSAMETLQLGLVGHGYWGPNLAQTFNAARRSRLVAICDARAEQIGRVFERYPGVRLHSDWRDLIADPEIDAVAIATPATTHYALALSALRAGKHVFVEKPLAATSVEAQELNSVAKQMNLILQVDHTLVYTGAVQKIRELVDSGQLGRIYYYDSVRIDLGMFQHDLSVIWDLAVHDLSIMDYILCQQPYTIAAVGAAHIAGRPVNTAYITCFFDGDLIAHLHVNWLAPVKIHQTLIGGDRQMIVYDDLEPSEKIKVYDKGVTITTKPGQGMEGAYELLVGYRAGDILVPQLRLTEALEVEIEHFVECVRTGRLPLTDGASGLRVIRLLETAERSITAQGARVEVQ